jgi:arsenate reductase (glutaredoxin)
MNSITVYGIPNCDTVKKARLWLTEHGLAYLWHDYKKQGVPPELEDWVQALGWAKLLNTQGTTWRKLGEAEKAAITDAAAACQLMRAQPSVIRRPVVCWADGRVSAGFAEALFLQHSAA